MLGSEVRLWAGNEKFPFGYVEYKVLVRYLIGNVNLHLEE